MGGGLPTPLALTSAVLRLLRACDLAPVAVEEGHETELRRIRAQATLQDLITNDPIISQRPDEALEAFNEIVGDSPGISRFQKRELRATYRRQAKRLQQLRKQRK